MKYSTEKFNDGSIIIFLYCKIGIIPILYLKDQEALISLIDDLSTNIDKVPDIYNEAFNE